jgi:hypothetical protein
VPRTVAVERCNVPQQQIFNVLLKESSPGVPARQGATHSPRANLDLSTQWNYNSKKAHCGARAKDHPGGSSQAKTRQTAPTGDDA